MGNILSDASLNAITPDIISYIKTYGKPHIISGIVNPYAIIFRMILERSTTLCSKFYDEAILVDDSIESLSLAPLITTNTGAIVGIVVNKNRTPIYESGVPYYISEQMESIAWDDETKNIVYFAVSTVLKAHIHNDVWLSNELSRYIQIEKYQKKNVPIYHASIFLDTGETEINVSEWMNPSTSEPVYENGYPINVIRDEDNVGTVGVSSGFQVNDHIKVTLVGITYNATCIECRTSENVAVFALDNLLNKPICMNSAGSTGDPYNGTELRTYVKGLYGSIPADIQRKMVPFENGDYFTIPSIEEVFWD